MIGSTNNYDRNQLQLQFQHKQNMLFQIICKEIHRDGGMTRLTSLPNYNPLISKLLTKMNKTKLVAFLSCYPDYFHVDVGTNLGLNANANAKSHFVKLLRHDWGAMNEDIDAADTDADAAMKISTGKILHRRTTYELQKRISKLRRRQTRSQNDNTELIETETTAPLVTGRVAVSIIISPASLDWLCRKVQNELHSHLRLFPNDRPMGVMPLSDEWFPVAQEFYLQFLEEHSISSSGSGGADDDNHNNDSDAGFRLSKKDDLVHVHWILPTSMVSDENGHRSESGSEQEGQSTRTCIINKRQVERIAAKLKANLRTKAPPIGGMDFGKLLQDYQLRRLTGGIDLKVLIDEHPDLFEGVRVFRDDKRGGKGCLNSCTDGSWYIELMEDELNDNDPNRDVCRKPRSSALAADDVGTFSLTKPRLATAMAKLLYNACKYGHLGAVNTNSGDESSLSINSSSQSTAPSCTESSSESFTCIDLTAGVGGNTIAFGKIFDQVFAYEIDSSRVQLLEKNLDVKLSSSEREKVLVQCTDSIGALNDLSRTLRRQGDWCDKRIGSRVAVFVDPPFGGLHYRVSHKLSSSEDFCESLNLGEDMPLTRVVGLISVHFSPVVIGLKLPLIFDVPSFVKKMENPTKPQINKAYKIRVQVIKKMERQLFVVLAVR